jgi:hypothetical protein
MAAIADNPSPVSGDMVKVNTVPLSVYESAVKGRADFRDALVAERQKSATLIKVVANFANPDYWIDEPGRLQWTGKRHAIEFAQSVLDDLK